MATAARAVSQATCCIVGGGPAGAMLGLLLARAGVGAVVLEKHRDFLRDFRGDTIHTSTIALMDELGLGEAFRRLPHQVVPELKARAGDQTFTFVDFRALGGDERHIFLMPQWDFLDFVAAEASRYPGFRLLMGAEATGLLRQDGRVAGVAYRYGGETHEVRADLTVACDGRDSRLRDEAGLSPVEFGAPMDVLWFRLPTRADDPADTFARLGAGRMLALINRADYWQAAYVIPKGSLARLRSGGIDEFRTAVRRLAPFFDESRLAGIASWDDVKLLRVQVNRLRRWHVPGLLFIGDAAHAMSPVGGVGINLAVQDAVATANLLAGPLRTGTVTRRDLARVQRRRQLPTVVTQGLQRLVQRRFLSRVLGSDQPVRPPPLLLVALRARPLRRLLAHLIGIGVRAEHIRSGAAAVPADRRAT